MAETIKIKWVFDGAEAAKKAVKGINKALERTADVAAEASKSLAHLETVGNKLVSIGRSLTIGITVPIVALGVASITMASAFESAFAGVRKTVNATEAEYSALAAGIRKMAKEIPASAEAIAEVAEAAGQLGIKKEAILEFTRTMIDLGNTTNLSATEAATALARFANIVKLPAEEISNLASTVVDLGNNFATTEAEIIEMGLRMAASAKIVGLLESDTLALAAAMTSVGIQAEAGGTAMSKIMIELKSAIQKSGDELDDFAKVAGLSSQKFKEAFKVDATNALVLFIEGLDKMAKSGKNVFGVLEDMGLAEVRVQRALLSAAGAGDLLRESIDRGRIAWKENTALTKEAEERYKTFESKLKIFNGRLKDIFKTLGGELIPAFLKFLDIVISPLINKIDDLIKGFTKLSPFMKSFVISMTTLAAITPPLVIALGGIVAALPFIAAGIKLIGLSMSKSLKALAIVAAIVTIGAAAWAKYSTEVEEVVKANEDIAKSSQKAAQTAFFTGKVHVKANTDIVESTKVIVESTNLAAEAQKAIAELILENAQRIFRTQEAKGEQIVKIAQIEFEEATKLSEKLGKLEEARGVQILKIAQIEIDERGKIQTERGKQILKIAQIEIKEAEKVKDKLGRIEEEKGRQIAKIAGIQQDEMKTITFDSIEIQRLAAQGLADSLKLIWNDSNVTFEDAWQGALDTFVDVMAQMLIENEFNMTLIQVQTAAATAGITLLIGLIASTFTGKKGGKSEMQKATDQFLKEIKRSLEEFENGILSTLEKTTRNIEKSRIALDIIRRASEAKLLVQEFERLGGDVADITRDLLDLGFELSGRGFEVSGVAGFLQDTIVKNGELALDFIKKEFSLKKEAINEIFNLLKRETDFVKDIDSSITDVKRAFFSPEELFEAQKKDIQDLQGLIAVNTGETKLGFIADLKQAYLDSFETAKILFEGDPEKLKSWQSSVIAGLEGVKDSGADAFRDLVNVQLEILNIDKKSVITREKMQQHLEHLERSSLALIRILGEVSGNDFSGLPSLSSLIDVLFSTGTPIGLAHGGVITRPTIALLGEGGEPEVVVPLSKAGQMGFGGGTQLVQNFNGPVIFDEISMYRFSKTIEQKLVSTQKRF